MRLWRIRVAKFFLAAVGLPLILVAGGVWMAAEKVAKLLAGRDVDSQ